MPEQGRPGWDGSDAAAAQTHHYATLPGALIRRVISAIGAEAGNEGDCWRTGLRVFEAENRCWVLIEAHPGEDHAGTLTIRTDGANAASLLSRMVKIVEEQEARLGLSPIEVEGSTAATVATAGDRDQEASITYERPKTPTDDWFFSYANADESASGTPGRVKTFCDRIKAEKGITIRRDVNELNYGDAIEPFLQELSQGNRIYIWLTDKYLKSPYCMYELHAIWRHAQQSADDSEAARRDFHSRVTVVLDRAKIRLETDLAAYASFWKTQPDAINADMVNMLEIDEVTYRDRNAISRFYRNTSSILR